ncbi:hypothetical protein AWB71_00058 [Caballeronia peredens]|nr:hypothetical protein AWB71_00058 [Caballeronia peredens]
MVDCVSELWSGLTVSQMTYIVLIQDIGGDAACIASDFC